MKLIVHIGFSDSAARLLQEFLARNRDELLDAGVLVPETGFFPSSNEPRASYGAGHDAFADAFGLERVQSRGTHFRSSMLAELVASPAPLAVLSSNLFGDVKRGAEPTQLLRVFRPACDVFPLIYLPRQDRLLDSYYRELLASTHLRLGSGIAGFADQPLTREVLDLRRRLQPWVEVFGRERLIVRSYDDSVKAGLIANFLGCLGVNESVMRLHSKLNNQRELIGRDVVNIMRAVNELQCLENENKRIVVNELLRHAQWVDDPSATEQSLVPLRLWSDLAERYRGDNQWLATELIAGSSREFTFPERRARVRVSRGGCSMEEARRVVRSEWPQVSRPSVPEPPHILAMTRMAALRVPNKPKQPRIGLTSLIRSSFDELRNWVYYHLNLGIEHIVLFIDGPPFHPQLRATPGVTIIECDAEFWRNLGVYNPVNIVQKQQPLRKLGQRALAARGMDWVINVDGDELLYGDISAELIDAPPSASLIRFRPLEAVQHDDQADFNGFGSRVFKVPAALLGHDQRRADPWADLEKVTRSGFFGHTEGKSAARSNVVADFWGCHTLVNTHHHLVETSASQTVVLHFDNLPFEEWRRRWQQKLELPVDEILLGAGPRRSQIEMLAEPIARGDDEVLRELHRSWFWMTESQIDELEASGIVVRLDIRSSMFSPP